MAATTTDVGVRRARPEDEPDLIPIWNTWSVRTTLARAMAGEMVYLVAETGGRVVAQLCLDAQAVPRSGYIYAVSVDEAFRSRGIGTLLLREAAAIGRAQGLEALTLKVEHTNLRAQSLYVRLGYRVTGDGFDEWDERSPEGEVTGHVRVPTWMMRKVL